MLLIVAVFPKQMATSLSDYPNRSEEGVAQPPWISTSYPTSTTMACPTTHSAHNRPFSLYAKTPKSFGPCHCRIWTWHRWLTNPEHVEMYKSHSSKILYIFSLVKLHLAIAWWLVIRLSGSMFVLLPPTFCLLIGSFSKYFIHIMDYAFAFGQKLSKCGTIHHFSQHIS